MIHKRYDIRAGATTTAGGIVKASSNFFNLNGAPVAREGDPVDCPACGSQGVIECVMPRLSRQFEGKEYALSDDLCICQCNPPPKLIADQDFSYQTLVLASVETAEQTAARKLSAKVDGLLPMRFYDQETGKPHANRPYRLDMRNGTVIAGTTDKNGCTRPLTTQERDALVARHLAPTAAEA